MVYKLFIGDDTNGVFGRKFYFTPVSQLDLTGCVAEFSVAGVKKTFANLVSGEPQELVFTREETGRMKRGLYRASLSVIDALGKRRTIQNDIPVIVTDVVEEVYSGTDNSIRFVIDSGVSWDGISGKPNLVTKPELGNAISAIEVRDDATQREVRNALKTLVAALKGIATCVVASVCLSSFGIGPATEWQDVPPTNLVKGVVELFSPPADLSTNNQQLVDTIVEVSPRVDFTTNNAQLVSTIEATAPIPDLTTGNTQLVATIRATAPSADLTPASNYTDRAIAALPSVLSNEYGNVSLADSEVSDTNPGSSLAHGYLTYAAGLASHAEGDSTYAQGMFSHAEGGSTAAWGTHSHAEGYNSTSFGDGSHAEGAWNIAEGFSSHADGIGSYASNSTSYVWHGIAGATPDDDQDYEDVSSEGLYGSHGPGTYNVSPAGGADGFYIGETNLSQTIRNYSPKGYYQKPADGIPASDLASNAVTSVKIANGAVTVAKLSNSAVTAAKISYGAVTEVKLADKAVTGRKLADDVRTSMPNEIVATTTNAAVVHVDSELFSIGTNELSVVETNRISSAGTNRIFTIGNATPSRAGLMTAGEHVKLGSIPSDVGNTAVNAISIAKLATNDCASTRAIVTTWEGFLDGSNVVFSITNYLSGSYNLDTAKLKILELRDGSYQQVYNSRDEIVLHIDHFRTNEFAVATNSVVAAVASKLERKADRAWGMYTSSGGDAPSNTVYMTAPNTVFAGGLEYERVAVGEGMVCVLTTRGAPAYTQGDEGTFKFQDSDGEHYFGFSKTDSYTIGANTDGITAANGLVTLTYNITMSGLPCVWYKADLTSSAPWEQLNYPDGSAVDGASHAVSWEQNPPANTQVCYINCGNEPTGFFRTTVEVAGEAKFMTNMRADFAGGIQCTNTSSGVVGVIRPSFDGTSVNWTWSAD